MPNLLSIFKEKDDNLNKHDLIKRQSEQNCQCKDGIPGPRGPPGSEGKVGMEGKQGRKGEMEMKGDVQGLQGQEVILEIEDHEE